MGGWRRFGPRAASGRRLWRPAPRAAPRISGTGRARRGAARGSERSRTAIPVELLEAELFGIGPRVATGVAGRAGKFAEAEGGSLFLDEIAEMPVELQAKLLRVLQEGALEPLGNVRELKSAVERLVWSCPPFQAIDGGLVQRMAQSSNLSPESRESTAPPGAESGHVPPPPLNLEELEKEAIREAMRRARSNQVRAAKLLGISRHQLRRRLKLYGLLGGEGTSSSPAER